MEQTKQLLERVEELFMRYGIKSVTMDDIARELGISKKTLYQHVENKVDLIKKVIHQHVEEEKSAIAEICDQSQNAVEEMLRIARYVTQQLRRLSPTTVYDLKKHHQDCWQIMESLHTNHVYNCIRDNVQRGINEGLYRSGLQADLISRLYVGTSFLLVDERLFPYKDFPRSELVQEYMNYHIRGIATPKGIAVLEEFE